MGGVDLGFALALLATIGVASAVAMNAAMERMERVTEDVEGATSMTRKHVYRLRHAELGLNATLITSFGVLMVSHLLALCIAAATVSSPPDSRPSWVVALLAAVILTSFFLVATARLAAPYRTPLYVRQYKVSKRIEARFVKALRKQARASSVAVLLLGTASVVLLLIPALWISFPYMLGAGGAPVLTPRGPALYNGAGMMLVFGFAAVCEQLLRFSSIEAGWIRRFSVLLSVSTFVLMLLVLFVVALTNDDMANGWKVLDWQGWSVVGLWLLLCARLILRILGRAAIGPERDRGLHMVLRGREYLPPSLQPIPWLHLVIACTVALLTAAGAAIASWPWQPVQDLLGRWAVFGAVGLAALWLGMASVDRMARPAILKIWDQKVEVWRDVALRSVIVVSAVAVGALQLRLGTWGLAAVPWVGWTVGAASIGIWGRWVWAATFPLRLRKLSVVVGRHRQWLVRESQNQIAQQIAPDRNWHHAEIQHWLCSVERQAKETEGHVLRPK